MEFILIHYILFVISLLLNFIVGVLFYDGIHNINIQRIVIICWSSMFIPPLSIMWAIIEILRYVLYKN